MKGFFVISDISGYTEFLTESELSHASEIIQGIMKSMISQVTSPLKISNFQGDAILMYAPEEEIIVGQSLIHQIEQIYFSFQKHLQTTRFNTTCECKACSNTSKLDLKFFIHYGEYEIQKIGNREELIGTDIILIHRLMKNDVIEKTGIQAYALFTEKAANKLDLNGYCDTLIDHFEEVSNIGEIKIDVYSLKTAWEKYLASDTNRVVVDSEEDYVTIEHEIHFPPSVVWNYITKAELKKEWLQMTATVHTPSKKIKSESKGIYGKGSEYHCAHDSGDQDYRVVDWRPFHYMTVEGANPLFSFRQMTLLEPTEFGCKYTVRVIPHSKKAIRSFFNTRKAMKAQQMMQQLYNECHRLLPKYIEGHQKEIKVLNIN